MGKAGISSSLSHDQSRASSDPSEYATKPIRRELNPKSCAIGAQKSLADFQAAATAFELHIGFTRVDVEGTLRRLARKMHPDAGGTHETFQKLVSQRDLVMSQAADVPSETIPPRDLADAHRKYVALPRRLLLTPWIATRQKRTRCWS